MIPVVIAVGASYGLETTLLTGAFIGYGLSTLDYESINENYLGKISVTASDYTLAKGIFLILFQI